MDGIDYYPYHSKIKYKPKLLIIFILLIALLVSYILFTKEKVITNDEPGLIFISEPKKILPNDIKASKVEEVNVSAIQETIYEIEQLDEVSQVHNKLSDKQQ